ncbi:O-methyltransferase [Luteithermobacter gelatinilyticus]|uniref:O-methyltransferase n=1 Tax=Luteithermobacter gelatinilyticus TaxID=2582913 RepID=UPI00143D1650|nr:class I SAM-dependent methyltransferase [Luteithermobacter gelatinilyticus]
MGKQSTNVIRNIESLDSLYRELKFPRSLPPTMGFAASPDFLRLIADYAASEDVDHILECSSGISTIVLAQVMKLKGRGHVYSLENDAQYADISRENLKKYDLEDWATVITAPLTEVSLQGQVYNWYDIDEKLPDIEFDGLVVDGPPWSVSENARYPAGPQLFGKLKTGAHIFLDDFVREGEQKAVEMWLRDNPNITLFRHPLMKGCAELVKN